MFLPPFRTSRRLRYLMMTLTFPRPLFVLSLVTGLGWHAVQIRADDTRAIVAAAEFFEKEVRPLLVEKCLKCHDDQKAKSGLRLTSRPNLLKGGENGPALVPGKPDDSLIVKAIRQTDELKMPPKEKLKDEQIAKLVQWIKNGAVWPESTENASTVTAPKGLDYQFTDEQRKFWSFQPVQQVVPPEVRDTTWPKSEIDCFILSALQSRGLPPAARADK